MPLSPRQTHPGIPLHSEAKGGGLRETVGEIPPEWRCALDLSVTEQPVPYDTDIPLLSDTILSTRVEQQFTSESMLRQVTKPAGVVTLEEVYTDKYKQTGTRTRKFRPITDLPLIAVPGATRDVNTKNLGNYHFIEDIEDSGTLFTQQDYIVERPDSAPEKFKELLPLTTESHIEIGIATLPVLDDSEYREEQSQQDVYTKKVSSTFRDPINFPATLGMFRMTPEQQIATGLDTLDDNSLNISTISVLTIEASAEDLGDGTWTKRQFDVPDVFHHERFVTERDILGNLPAEFRSGIERVTISSEIAGIATQPVLASGVEYASQEQITVFKKKVEERAIDFDSIGSLVDYRMTQEQQLETITKEVTTIAPTPSSFTATTVESEIRTLGGGLWLQVEGTVPDVFDHVIGKTSIPDLIPQEFRGILPTRTLSSIAVGTADPTPLLGPGDLSREEDQITEFKVKTTVESRDPSSLPATLTSYKLTKDKQIETIVGTLNTGLQTITGIDELTIEAEVQNLGNNLSLKRIGSVATLFTALQASTEIIDLVPDFYKAVLPTHIEELNVAGTVVDPPVLAAGDFEKTETQIDVFTKRVRTRGRAGLSLPQNVVADRHLTEEYGGEVVKTTALLDSSAPTIESGLGVLTSKVVDLGNGLFLRETTKWDTATFWPVLESRLWDDNMRVEYDQTEQVVAAGTAEDPDPGGVFGWTSEVRAIDQWRSKKTNSSKPTPAYVDEASALISYVYKPYRFPELYFSGTGYYVRSADATLTQHKIKTWWEKSISTPTPAFDEIILDDVVINNLSGTGLTYSGPVLHDSITVGIIFYPATTPSYTQYALGTVTGSAISAIPSIYSSGTSGGYEVGDVVNIDYGGNFATATVSYVYDIPGGPTGIVGVLAVPCNSNTFPVGNYGPIAATGGSGSGLICNLWVVELPTYIPGTAWIGTYRIIGASVTPEKEKNVWKIQTESVVMR